MRGVPYPGGGIGQTPFLTLAQECLGIRQFGDPPRQVPIIRDVTLCYGARTDEFLACVDDFRTAGVDVRLSTDDGSEGHHGLVTDLIRPVVEESFGSCRIVDIIDGFQSRKAPLLLLSKGAQRFV